VGVFGHKNFLQYFLPFSQKGGDVPRSGTVGVLCYNISMLSIDTLFEFYNKHRYYVYAGGLILVFLIVTIILLVNNTAKIRDIQAMSEIRQLSYGLESYYEEHWTYPRVNEQDLRKGITLADNSSDQTAGKLYYQGKVPAVRATLTSDGSKYEIKFKLRKKWSIVGMQTRSCTVTNNYVIDCGK